MLANSAAKIGCFTPASTPTAAEHHAVAAVLSPRTVGPWCDASAKESDTADHLYSQPGGGVACHRQTRNNVAAGPERHQRIGMQTGRMLAKSALQPDRRTEHYRQEQG